MKYTISILLSAFLLTSGFAQDFGDPLYIVEPDENRRSMMGEIFSNDLDRDGDNDLIIAASGARVRIIENNYDKSAEPNRNITNSYQVPFEETFGFDSVFEISDIDKQNGRDIVFSGVGAISWFQNHSTPENIQFSSRNNIEITGSRVLMDFIRTGDLDGDGDEDFIYSYRDNGLMNGAIGWIRNDSTSSSVSFASQQFLRDDDVTSFSPIYAADLNGDRRVEIISGSDNSNDALVWLEVDFDQSNPIVTKNGIPNYNQQLYISAEENPIFFKDLDSDHDSEIIFMGMYFGENVADNISGVLYLKNELNESPQSFSEPQLLFNYSNSGYRNGSLAFGDVDLDGDIDIISRSITYPEVQLRLHRNISTASTIQFSPPEEFGNSIQNGEVIALCDLTNDGVPDLITYKSSDQSLLWYENLNQHQVYSDAWLLQGF